MQYALLIYSKPGNFEALDEAGRQAVIEEYYTLRKDPRIVGGAQLAPVETATTVRARGDEPLITDGPFADTKEVFGGYLLLEADDLDAALDIAAKIPAVRLDGSVEIRPIVDMVR
jgi:hypothetical protein